ncbi:MAG TPA: VOC family protein [Candidatus Acidoferrum sp.]|nr:VOC family protein [Candidatus Acidoferrum sp.]
MIRGIKFVTVPVRDQERALKFYTEKLGFQIRTDQPLGNQRWIELGIPGAETELVLFTSPGHEALIGQFQPLVFWSNDVPKSYKEMSAKGIEFLGQPKTEEWGTSAMFRDVDGNQFLLSSK